MVEDGCGWKIANEELEKFRLNFSRCTNRDEVPLKTRDLFSIIFSHRVNRVKIYKIFLCSLKVFIGC